MLQGPLWPCPREEAQEVGRHPCPMVLLPHSPGSMVQPLNTEAKALPQCNLFLDLIRLRAALLFMEEMASADMAIGKKKSNSSMLKASLWGRDSATSSRSRTVGVKLRCETVLGEATVSPELRRTPAL